MVSNILALLCVFHGPLEGVVQDTRSLPKQHAGKTVTPDLELLIASGQGFYRIVGEDEPDKPPIEKGSRIILPEGPCEEKVG